MYQTVDQFTLLIAGGLGGIVECLVVQPFDMIKTRFQLNEKSKNTSVYRAFTDIYKEGGVFRFYRGMLPEAASMFPKSSIMYASYEVSRRLISERLEPQQNTWKSAFLAGICSGYAEAITVTPFQVLKVRLQAKEYLGRYKNTIDALFKIVGQEGITALMIGLGPTFWRNCVWNAVYFGLMFKLKDYLHEPNTHFKSLMQSLITGSLGGMAATCFNAPFDVVKSRFQSQIHDHETKSFKYRYTLLSLGLIYKQEGPQALYKGFAPKLIRMGLGGGVCMASFEGFCILSHHFWKSPSNKQQ